MYDSFFPTRIQPLKAKIEFNDTYAVVTFEFNTKNANDNDYYLMLSQNLDS